MPELITLTVDGIATTVEPGTTGTDLYSSRRDVVVARVDGELRDLHLPLADGAVVEAVTIDEPDGLAVLRHSAAHVLAQAVQEINPKARLGIGPPITDGFYYDFDVDTPFTPEDLKAIEKVMGRIVKEGQTFRRWDVTEDEARAELRDEPYKLRAHRPQGRPAGRRRRVGRGRSRRAEHLPERAWRRPRERAGRLAGPVPRPARPEHPPAGQRLPADPVRRGVLARVREEPAAAARLRHRVADQGRAARLPRAHRRGGASRPPPARHRAGPVLLPGRDRLRPGRVPPQGRRHPHGDGALQPAAARPGRVRVREHPAHHQGASCTRSRGTSTGTRRACTPR